MAYNYYTPVAYQPYGSYYPQNYLQQTQYQMPASQPATTSSIAWVSDLNEAKMYPIAPNNVVDLYEYSGKTIHRKSADSTGKPTLITYDLVERNQSAPEASSGKNDKTIDYVTKDELGKISSVLESIIGDLETMKGDLYGVAGRKKMASKKKEEVEDEE